MKNKNSLMKSMTRMAVTFGGSYLGGKLAGWVFDNIINRQSK